MAAPQRDLRRPVQDRRPALRGVRHLRRRPPPATSTPSPASRTTPAATSPAGARAGSTWSPLIGPAARAGKADVLLVSLGLIDLGFYTDAPQTAANVRRFVEEARAGRPAIRMVLLPVIPNVRAESDAPFAAEVTRFNELLAKAAADLSTDASPILLGARPSSYEIHHDTYDGTHPNASGEHRIAGEFASVLHQAWGIGAPYRPDRDA
ncbi:hypothetical protein GCM10020254_47660 [Streptomyces goshikiensis]